MKNLKKWNWSLFLITMLVCCSVVLTNKNIDTIFHAVIFALVFGIPFCLFMAWLTKDTE